MQSLQHCFVQTHICKKDFLEWVNFTYNHSWLWFKWFWNLYCTRKGSHIPYFEETSDPIHKLDFEAKEKVHPSWNRLLHDEIKLLWDSAFYYNLHPSKICRAFSRLKKKKVLLPEKCPTRVARDAAVVHPPFWDRLQKTDFQYFSMSTNIYELLPFWTLDSYLSLNTWWQTAHSARLVVWFKLEGWMSIIVLDKLPSCTFLEYLCNDSTVIWPLSWQKKPMQAL